MSDFKLTYVNLNVHNYEENMLCFDFAAYFFMYK